jgi:excisionase family DNA binding protein
VNGLPDKAHYRPATVAKFLDVSLSKIYEMIDYGDIPSIRVGSSIRIPADKFQKWYVERDREDRNKLSA